MSTRARPPRLPPPTAPTLPPVARHALANGLDLFIVPRHELPVVDVRLVLRGGATTDEPPHAGRSWMLGQLLDQGTASRAATDIADQAEHLGATLETRTTWDAVTASLHVLSPRFEPALELLADVVLDPTFPDDELERKRHERLAAILQENDEPRSLATHAFYRYAYPPDHPFAVPLAGTRSSIEALDRRDICRIHTERFSPAGAFLVIVGDVDPDRALPTVERLFGDWTRSRAAPPAVPGRVPDRPTRVHIVDRPGAPQSELRVGRPGPRRDSEDYFPLLVGNTVLGGAFTSRLNMRLREEKAYTYGAGSSFAFRAAGGPFLASTAVATAATADAVHVTVGEIGRLVEEPVEAGELERAVSYIVLGLPRTFETTGDIAEHVTEVALYGLGPDYYDRYVDEVRSVTAADVQVAMSRWLSVDGLTIAIAGDGDAVREELEALTMGVVHVCEDD